MDAKKSCTPAKKLRPFHEPLDRSKAPLNRYKCVGSAPGALRSMGKCCRRVLRLQSAAPSLHRALAAARIAPLGVFFLSPEAGILIAQVVRPGKSETKIPRTPSGVTSRRP